MLNWIKSLLTGNQQVDFLYEDGMGPDTSAARFSATKQRQDFLAGSGDKPVAFDRKEAFPEIKAGSFAEAAALPKGFSDRFILGAVNSTLREPDGTNAMLLKHYLDSEMPDGEEISMSKSPHELSQFHADVVDMVASNLKVGTAGLSTEQKQFIKFQRDQYVANLRKRSNQWQGYIEQAKAGKNPDGFVTSVDLRGLNIRTGAGNVDISQFGSDKIPGIHSNIRIQSSMSDQFVHWQTDQALIAEVSGNKLKMDKRIYLNPNTDELVSTFSGLMTALNKAGIPVRGKMLDRSTELAGRIREQHPRTVRADAIMLAVQDADADRVLGMVLDEYQKDPSRFTDRPTPKIPFKIAPGIAIGDNPPDGDSLTANREGLITNRIVGRLT